MTLEDGIYAYLSTLPTLNALVNGRIYADIAPENDDFPRVTYTIISDPSDQHMGGSSGMVVGAEVQLDVWALDSVTRAAIAEALRNGINGLRHAQAGPILIAYANIKNRVRSIEKPSNASEAAVFRLRMEVSVAYTESIPTLS